ncbi:unnamed protein product [Ceratitis capitata]|uniref:(Mediterranean fruit fly) hypothetical protein n=1 Tax=Ceratitis capitata TaxID=7213 RepID=A0A811V4E7_CERCA|nr:unnamed protein product [Ceratitis capitata]
MDIPSYRDTRIPHIRVAFDKCVGVSIDLKYIQFESDTDKDYHKANARRANARNQVDRTRFGEKVERECANVADRKQAHKFSQLSAGKGNGQCAGSRSLRPTSGKCEIQLISKLQHQQQPQANELCQRLIKYKHRSVFATADKCPLVGRLADCGGYNMLLCCMLHIFHGVRVSVPATAPAPAPAPAPTCRARNTQTLVCQLTIAFGR